MDITMLQSCDGSNPMPTESHRHWYHNGTLPHFDAAIVYQAITSRLADSLPRAVLARIVRAAEGQFADDADASAQAKYRGIELLLDQGLGSCLLRDPVHAERRGCALAHFHGVRYDLIAWVVMPNHVHVLIRQRPDMQLSRIIQSWKIYTAKQMAATGPVWQRDYWDRFIRDSDHFDQCVAYIHDNPVKAGLVDRASQWRWSSAYIGA